MPQVSKKKSLPGDRQARKKVSTDEVDAPKNRVVRALIIQPANAPKSGCVSKVPGLKIEPGNALRTQPVNAPRTQVVNALIIQPGNALKMEMVDTRKFGTRRAENPARVAVCEIACGSPPSKLRTGRWGGVTSVVTHVVNAGGSNPVATLPFVRDVLVDGHLLGSARGIDSSDTLLVIIEAVHSMDTLSCQVLARQRPFGAHTLRTRLNCVLGIRKPWIPAWLPHPGYQVG